MDTSGFFFHLYGQKMKRKDKARLLLWGLGILLPVMMLFSIATGPVTIPVAEIVQVLLANVGLAEPDPGSRSALIIEAIRLPRTLLGVLVGSTLAVCGAAMQGLFRNPLADPGIIGVASGAALGAGIAIVLGGMLPFTLQDVLKAYSVSVLAFVGGFGATLLVYRIGTTANGTSVATMLLAGIAIGALSGAGMGTLNYIADDAMLRNMTFWSMGSLGGANWQNILLTAPFMIVLQLLLIGRSRGLNALLLGESEARHLGQNVNMLKLQLILLTALGVGLAVSLAGMIGFVGLVVPHLVRMFIGPDHRYLMPASCLLGAALLLGADMIARVIVAPAELPIGIVTALLGAPFFISLLLQQRNRIG
ncbi:FecCD family ABC transporter permease [Endozoicomonadaceae bacterium StTr2]